MTELRGGELGTPAHDFVILLSTNKGLCSGALLGAHAVIVAKHCLVGVERVELRRGTFGDEALGTFELGTNASALQVASHPTADLAVVLRSEGRWPEPTAGFPRLLEEGQVFESFRAAGFGVGSVRVRGKECWRSAGSTLIVGDFSAAWTDETFVGAIVGQKGSAVCAGDSGGPAFVGNDAKVELVGLLTQSSEAASMCSEQDGIQLWERLAPQASWIATMMQRLEP